MVFVGTPWKGVKSEQSWIGSLDDKNRVALAMKTASAPQQNSKLVDAAMPRLVCGTGLPIGGDAGGTAKRGWSPRKGRRLSPFLGASLWRKDSVGLTPISQEYTASSTGGCNRLY